MTNYIYYVVKEKYVLSDLKIVRIINCKYIIYDKVANAQSFITLLSFKKFPENFDNSLANEISLEWVCR